MVQFLWNVVYIPSQRFQNTLRSSGYWMIFHARKSFHKKFIERCSEDLRATSLTAAAESVDQRKHQLLDAPTFSGDAERERPGISRMTRCDRRLSPRDARSRHIVPARSVPVMLGGLMLKKVGYRKNWLIGVLYIDSRTTKSAHDEWRKLKDTRNSEIHDQTTLTIETSVQCKLVIPHVRTQYCWDKTVLQLQASAVFYQVVAEFNTFWYIEYPKLYAKRLRTRCYNEESWTIFCVFSTTFHYYWSESSIFGRHCSQHDWCSPGLSDSGCAEINQAAGTSSVSSYSNACVNNLYTPFFFITTHFSGILLLFVRNRYFNIRLACKKRRLCKLHVASPVWVSFAICILAKYDIVLTRAHDKILHL